MPYRVQLDDVTIIVDSEAELRVAIRAIRDYRQLPLIPPVQAERVDRQVANGVRAPDPPNPYLRFWNRARAVSIRTMLTLLAENPAGLDDSELRSRLNLTGNSQLGGVVSGITKNAKAVDLDFHNVVTKRRSGYGRGRTYHYVLVPGMRDFMQSLNGARG